MLEPKTSDSWIRDTYSVTRVDLCLQIIKAVMLHVLVLIVTTADIIMSVVIDQYDECVQRMCARQIATGRRRRHSLDCAVGMPLDNYQSGH